MKTKKRLLMQYLVLGLTLCILSVLANVAYAQTSGYNLTWWTIDSGGGSSSGGSYTLSATIGQPDAGQMSGGAYNLAGGFWGGGKINSPSGWVVYLPLIVR
jgi:hypothetical protein